MSVKIFETDFKEACFSFLCLNKSSWHKNNNFGEQVAYIELGFYAKAGGWNTKHETTNREAFNKHLNERLRDRHVNICFVRRI